MKKPVVHRHVKTSVVISGAVIALLVVAYFLLEYRAARVVELIVEKQSNSQFQLKSEDLDISFLKRKIEVNDAVIQRIDTNTNHATASIRFPLLTLQLNSWSELVFQKKLIIDSVYLVDPIIETTIDSSGANNDISFQAAKIFKSLQDIVQLLNVHSFRMQNGSLILHNSRSSLTFEIHGVNFSLINFGGEEKNPNRFLSSDEMEVTIPQQDWKFEDGLEIKFHHFHFSGSKQDLQLDSCEFVSVQDSTKGEVRIFVDRISFDSDSLSAFFEEGELIIDTLIFTHPVVRLELRDHATSSDTTAAINQSLQKLFPNIHVSHLDIEKGQFAVQSIKGGKKLSYTTNETDVRIDEISFRPKEASFLTIGNLSLQLKQLALFTADSLYQLTLEEFDVNNFDVRFKNALFSPASGNHKGGSFQVAIPVLSLHRLRLEDLFENRLGAEEAEMISPVVTIASSGKEKNEGPADEKLAGFYQVLHGLSELLHVKTLNVTNATLNYHSSAADNLTASMKNFNTTISLTNFLNSATLIDIKHSIPYFHVESIHINSKKVTATLENFQLHGTFEHNGVSSVELQTTAGITFQANDFYWHHLDWDTLIDKHAITADSVHMGKLSINSNEVAKKEPGESKELPLINIRQVAVDKFEMQYKFPTGGLFTAKGKNYLLSQVSTVENKFSWNNASGDFTSVKYKTEGLTASIDKVHLETPGETKLDDIRADFLNKETELHADIDEVKVQANITSTDLTELNLESLLINKPQVNFVQTKNDSISKESFEIPLDLTVGELKVKKGKMNYTLQNTRDTIRVSSALDMSADSFRIRKNKSEMLQFENLRTAFSNLSFSKEKLSAKVPSSAFTFKGGKVGDDSSGLNLQTSISGSWNDAAVIVQLKKQSQLDLSNISGGIDSIALKVNPGQKINWIDWLKQADVTDSKVLFVDSSTTVSAGKAMWDPVNHNLSIDSFILQPKQNPREFFRQSAWQSDYIKLKGGNMLLSGFDPDVWINDSLFQVHKIYLQNFYVDVSRDKRIPFHHGVEKMMPTKLLNSIQTRFSIDSVQVQNGSVRYHEFSDLTGREGTVPIENITAVLKNVNNNHQGRSDTLSLKGSAQMLDINITKFHYKEVYNDSLSSFLLTVKAAPAQLSELSKITNPLMAIDVTSGQCDTMNARATGNKYASIGQMQFNYRDLKIALQNHQDTLNKRLSMAFVTFVANSFVIKSKNKKRSAIFFVRDREKFIFNYWIKTILSGVLTSAGIKRNKKYEKEYERMKEQYTLPPMDLE